MRFVLATAWLITCLATPAWAFEPSADIRLGEQPHTISGRTNFPDGTVLIVSVYRVESGFVNLVDTTVNKGEFETPDLSSVMAPMNPGNYKIVIWTAPGLRQPSSVRDVIGENGEKLSGPHINMAIYPIYELTTSIVVPGTLDPKQDARFKQAARDKEVSGIGEFCQSFYGRQGDEAVRACADQSIKKIPD